MTLAGGHRAPGAAASPRADGAPVRGVATADAPQRRCVRRAAAMHAAAPLAARPLSRITVDPASRIRPAPNVRSPRGPLGRRIENGAPAADSGSGARTHAAARRCAGVAALPRCRVR